MGFPWTEQLTQGLTIAANGLHSGSQSTGQQLTAAADLQKFRKVLFLIDSGTIGASGTLDFQVLAATTSGGSYTAVPGTAMTELASTAGNNKYVLVEVSADHLQNALPGYRYVKGALTPGTAAANSAVIVLGALGDHEPTANNADASLTQTVVL